MDFPDDRQSRDRFWFWVSILFACSFSAIAGGSAPIRGAAGMGVFGACALSLAAGLRPMSPLRRFGWSWGVALLVVPTLYVSLELIARLAGATGPGTPWPDVEHAWHVARKIIADASLAMLLVCAFRTMPPAPSPAEPPPLSSMKTSVWLGVAAGSTVVACMVIRVLSPYLMLVAALPTCVYLLLSSRTSRSAEGGGGQLETPHRPSLRSQFRLLVGRLGKAAPVALAAYLASPLALWGVAATAAALPFVIGRGERRAPRLRRGLKVVAILLPLVVLAGLSFQLGSPLRPLLGPFLPITAFILVMFGVGPALALWAVASHVKDETERGQTDEATAPEHRGWLHSLRGLWAAGVLFAIAASVSLGAYRHAELLFGVATIGSLMLATFAPLDRSGGRYRRRWVVATACFAAVALPPVAIAAGAVGDPTAVAATIGEYAGITGSLSRSTVGRLTIWSLLVPAFLALLPLCLFPPKSFSTKAQTQIRLAGTALLLILALRMSAFYSTQFREL
jgi:hypothetical protein